MAGGHLFTDQIEAAAAHDDALPADSPDRLLDNNGNFVGSPSFAQSILDHKDIKCPPTKAGEAVTLPAKEGGFFEIKPEVGAF